MKKLFAAALLCAMLLVGSNVTAEAADLSVSSAGAQADLQELSAWPRIRNFILGMPPPRPSHPKKRWNPPPEPVRVPPPPPHRLPRR